MSNDGNKSTRRVPFTMFSSSADGGYLTDFHANFTPGVEINNLHTDTYGTYRNAPMQGPFTEQHVGGLPHRHTKIILAGDISSSAGTTSSDGPEGWWDETPLFVTPLDPGPEGPDTVWELDINGDLTPLTSPTDNTIWELVDAASAITPGEPDYDPSSRVYRLDCKPEGFYIVPLAGNLNIYGPDHRSDVPRSWLYRDEFAKRPLNIRNIKNGETCIGAGNFTKEYEVVQIAGRTLNPRHYAEHPEQYTTDYALNYGTEGKVFNNLTGALNTPATGTLSEYTLPDNTGSLNNFVFVNRFSAPGDRYTMSRGFLNPKGEELSAYNASPFRNLNVRKELSEDLATHTPKATDIPPSSSTKYHTTNRNTRLYKILSGSSSSTVIDELVYDDGYVTHAIPQSTLQYSWIAASAETTRSEFPGFATGSGIQFYSNSVGFDNNGICCPAGVVMGCTDPLAYNYDPCATSDDGSCDYSYPPWPPKPNRSCRAPMNNIFIEPLAATQSFDFTGSAYTYGTWKQIRGGELALSRHYRENSILPVTNRNDETTQYIEPPIVAKHQPMEHVLSIDGQGTPYLISSVYGNKLTRYSNEAINLLYDFKVSDKGTMYSRLLDLYLSADPSDTGNPVKGFYSLTYGQTLWPKDENTFMAKVRLRGEYTEIPGTGPRGYDRLYGTQNTMYRSAGMRSSDAKNSQGYIDDSLAFDPMRTDGIRSFPDSGSFSGNVGELNFDTDLSLASLTAKTSSLDFFETNYIRVNETSSDYNERLVEQMSGKGRWYNSYDDFAANSKGIMQEASILPEFRISEHMDYYTNQAAGNFRAENKNFLSLLGAQYSSSADSTTSVTFDTAFEETYLNSEKFENLDKIRDDHIGFAKPSKITIKASGVKKLLPYNGFYPDTRTVQLGNLLSSSIADYVVGFKKDPDSPSVEEKFLLPSDTAGYSAFLKSLASPGLLYNSLKSGLAVDYPLYTEIPELSSSTDNPTGEIALSSSVTASISLPFETLVNVNENLPKDQNIFLVSSNPSQTESNSFATSSLYYGRWNGKKRPTFELGMHNFLAESVGMFLDKGRLNSFISEPENKFQQIEPEKEYYMDVVLRDEVQMNKFAKYTFETASFPVFENVSADIGETNNGNSDEAVVIPDDTGGAYSLWKNESKDQVFLVYTTAEGFSSTLETIDDPNSNPSDEFAYSVDMCRDSSTGDLHIIIGAPERTDLPDIEDHSGGTWSPGTGGNVYAYDGGTGDTTGDTLNQTGVAYRYSYDTGTSTLNLEETISPLWYFREDGTDPLDFGTYTPIECLGVGTSVSIAHDGTDLHWAVAAKYVDGGASAGKSMYGMAKGAAAWMDYTEPTCTGSPGPAPAGVMACSPAWLFDGFTTFGTPGGTNIVNISIAIDSGGTARCVLSSGEEASASNQSGYGVLEAGTALNPQPVLVGTPQAIPSTTALRAYAVKNSPDADFHYAIIRKEHSTNDIYLNVSSSTAGTSTTPTILSDLPVNYVNDLAITARGSDAFVVTPWTNPSVGLNFYEISLPANGALPSPTFEDTSVVGEMRHLDAAIDSSDRRFLASPARSSVPVGNSFFIIYDAIREIDSKQDGRLFGMPIDGLYDPAYLAYTPPGFYGESVATLSFSSSLGGTVSVEEILRNLKITETLNLDPSLCRQDASGLAPALTTEQLEQKMRIGSCIDLTAKTSKPDVQFSMTEDGSISNVDRATTGNEKFSWAISTRYECPVLDVSSSLYAENYSSHRAALNDNPAWWSDSGEFSYPSSVWTSHGNPPDSSKGYYFELRESTSKASSDGSLIELCGFTAGTKKIGTVADKKRISEAVMVIPYVDRKIPFKTVEIEKGMHFIRFSKTELKRQKKNVEDKGYAISEENPTTSVSELISGMRDYVIPPQYNFLQYDDIKPFAAYFLEFDHDLTQRDLIDIWQGVMPSIAMNPETDEVEITHNFDKHNFFHNMEFPTDIKFMVFKVKKKANWNYYSITTDSTDDTRFKFDFQGDGKVEVVPDYNYNWPYDYCSLVDRAKVDVSVTFEKEEEE